MQIDPTSHVTIYYFLSYTLIHTIIQLQELCLQIEQSEGEVNNLRRINQELKKLLKQDPYGRTSQHGGPPVQVQCYVIVVAWVSRNYGSKRTDPEGAAWGRGLFT